MNSNSNITFLATILGERRAEEFAIFLGRLFWLPPIDRKQIFRAIVRKSSGNVRFRMGDVLVFPTSAKSGWRKPKNSRRYGSR